LDDFDGYIKDMAKDSDYKFSLQFEVNLWGLSPLRTAMPRSAFSRCQVCVGCSCALCCLMCAVARWVSFTSSSAEFRSGPWCC